MAFKNEAGVHTEFYRVVGCGEKRDYYTERGVEQFLAKVNPFNYDVETYQLVADSLASYYERRQSL